MSLITSKVTLSAGGVVIDSRRMILVVNQRGSSWSLPKGHVDPGEEPLDAAIREIGEESGIDDLKLLDTLGAYGRYRIGLNSGEDKTEWKIILLFLFKTGQNELKPRDPHNPQACWVKPEEVESLLTHPKDKAFFKRIVPLINEIP